MAETYSTPSPTEFRPTRAVKDVLRLVGGRIGYILLKTWPAIVALFAVAEGFEWLKNDLPAIFTETVRFFANGAISSFIAIYLQRFFLLNEEKYNFDLRIYWEYLIITLALSLLLFLPSGVAALTGFRWLLLLYLPALALSLAFWCRLLVILPAIAIGRNRGLEWAWLLTMRNGAAILGGWVMLGAIGAIIALALFGILAAVDLPIATLNQTGWPGSGLRFLLSGISVLTTGAAAVYMASVYRQLIVVKGGERPPSAAG